MSDHTQKRDNHTAGETPEFFTASDFHGDLEPQSQQKLADYCNRLLSKRGVRVYGDYPGKEIALWSPIPDKGNTHAALLIAVEPLKRESAADVLRDILRDWDKYAQKEYVDCDPEFKERVKMFERARRVIEREGGAK